MERELKILYLIAKNAKGAENGEGFNREAQKHSSNEN